MKTIVLGEGFLGKKFEMRGFDVFGKKDFYLTEDNVKKSLKKLKHYDTIINCTGKSNTRWCEKTENFPAALWSNSFVPKILSEYCEKENKKFVHISTGCLYDSNKFPQKESDFIVAHCNYTITKWAGEQGCNPEKDLILRPRLYFGDFEDKNNLLCKLPKFKNFLEEKNSYTNIETIVDATESLLLMEQSGIFNVACDGYLTVFDLAKLIGLKGKK